MRMVSTLLPNWRGAGPCVCPISSNARILGTKSVPLMNPAPVSVSWAEDTTTSRILEMTWIVLLCGGGVSVSLIGMEGLPDKK